MRLHLIILYQFCINCFAQLPNSDIQVSYQLYIDLDWPITYPATLHINNDITIFQTKPNLKEEWKGGKIKSKKVEYILSKNIEDDYLKMNYKEMEILFYDQLPKVTILVTDNFPEFDWVITKEIIELAGYRCTKAIATYRGRQWIAWFAPDIAVPYGPWKLHGLPGLIIEAYDSDKLYTFTATKIQYGKSAIFNRDFKTLRTTYNDKPMEYKQFLLDRTEAFQNIAQYMSRDGVETKFLEAPRSDVELRYEWEE